LRATTWEFRNRATVFGIIFGAAFVLYTLDHVNAAAGLANWIADKRGWDANVVVRVVLLVAAGFMGACAMVRTWASAYLRTDVVYAPDVKTAALVADGPYRHVRNPLYLGNALMAVGIGATASRAGFFVLFAAMILFCYRLIFREEADLLAAQGESYAAYSRAVPRLWPSIGARVPSAGAPANWTAGFRAEAWSWSLVAGLVVFAITLDLRAMFVATAAWIGLAWAWSRSGGHPQE
jgi:protein-S-isoprenylcysteine O-methyltransferase Ste14